MDWPGLGLNGLDVPNLVAVGSEKPKGLVTNPRNMAGELHAFLALKNGRLLAQPRWILMAAPNRAFNSSLRLAASTAILSLTMRGHAKERVNASGRMGVDIGTT